MWGRKSRSSSLLGKGTQHHGSLGKSFDLFHTVNISSPDPCRWDTGQTQPMCKHDCKAEMSNSRAMPHLQAAQMHPLGFLSAFSYRKNPLSCEIARGGSDCSWINTTSFQQLAAPQPSPASVQSTQRMGGALCNLPAVGAKAVALKILRDLGSYW